MRDVVALVGIHTPAPRFERRGFCHGSTAIQREDWKRSAQRGRDGSGLAHGSTAIRREDWKRSAQRGRDGSGLPRQGSDYFATTLGIRTRGPTWNEMRFTLR